MLPNTAIKLDEARLFLDRMAASEGQPEFQVYLVAFLNAANGLFDVMRGEYDQITGFRAWYATDVEPRITGKGDLRWFIDQRNQAQHRGALTLHPVDEELSFMPTQHPNPWRPRYRLEPPRRSSVMPGPGVPAARQYRSRWFFASVPGTDAWLHCDGHLGQLVAIAGECSNRFG